MEIIDLGERPRGGQIVAACLPPTRRTFMFNVNDFDRYTDNFQKAFLSLPYQVVTVSQRGYIRMLFSNEPVTKFTDSVYALPLSNTYERGYICGISADCFPDYPERTIKYAMREIFNTRWYIEPRYVWDQRYCAETPFLNMLGKITKKSLKSLKQKTPTFLGHTYQYKDVVWLWQEASAIDPNFILTAPMLKACTLADMLTQSSHT